ncbi:MAG: geranylgeranylglyceryl/heptaprenylglyceryl phosphate synthase [Bacteroidetes bacterium GWE2_29_8]|nr:MAG: geranylgeranylglyceryl/heptaprenylglyceryl phosphate synthase [Bacteroidetes bacterium GWE2_29_8]
MNIYSKIKNSSDSSKKLFTVLIDPDKIDKSQLIKILEKGNEYKIDYFFIGSSILINNIGEQHIDVIKQNTNIPVILFPGHPIYVYDNADGLLFLSLISGRNPEMLIGNHVIAAPILKNKKFEIIPTGYMLIDGGAPTSVTYMSNTLPIPYNKTDIAVCTAIAGEMLGLKLIYMDSGSGSPKPISCEMVKAVKKNTNIPLIIGGGIKTPEQAKNICDVGADMIVVGNAIEKDITLIKEISDAIHL